MIDIMLDYDNNRVVRRISKSSSNMNIHYLALSYLMEVFDILVTDITDVIVTSDSQEIPFHGLISAIPIKNGDIMEIAFRQRTLVPQTPNRVPSKYPGGSSRNYRGENHPLKGDRASSQPVTKVSSCALCL